MGDLLYVSSVIEDCLDHFEGRALWDDMQKLKGAATNLIVDIRSQIGAHASFPELCKNAAYYLHECLLSEDLKAKNPPWVCDLSKTAHTELVIIKQLVAQHQPLWDLVFEMHSGYIGCMVEESVLFKFPSLQKYRIPVKEAGGYEEIIEQLHVSRPPLV